MPSLLFSYYFILLPSNWIIGCACPSPLWGSLVGQPEVGPLDTHTEFTFTHLGTLISQRVRGDRICLTEPLGWMTCTAGSSTPMVGQHRQVLPGPGLSHFGTKVDASLSVNTIGTRSVCLKIFLLQSFVHVTLPSPLDNLARRP